VCPARPAWNSACGKPAPSDTISKVTVTALPPALDSHTLLVAAVIVHDKAADQVLLLQRGAASTFAPLHWDLPSGKADKGESITAAAARELREETGLTVDPATLRVAGIIHGAWGVEAPNGFLTIIFAAHQWNGEPVNAEPRKHARIAWFSVTEVPADLVPDRRHALLSYLQSPGEPVVWTDGFLSLRHGVTPRSSPSIPSLCPPGSRLSILTFLKAP
jgi:8-oxo-dGTP pyrophosphatase MutT (NUDIX family)